jgi:uncharacterized protein (DUF1330 family)
MRASLGRREKKGTGLGSYVLKSTIIVKATFRRGYEAHFAEYSGKVRAYLSKHGAEVVRRQRITKALYGSGKPDLIMVIDFPSVDIAERIFFEPEYLALIPLRDQVFSEFNMYVAAYGEI